MSILGTDVPSSQYRDSKVAESWMLNQDTVAILEFLKEAQKQIPSNLAKS